MSSPEYRTEATGHDKLAADLKVQFGEWLRATAAGLYIEGEETISESKRETPVDKGPLINSGHVELPVYTTTTVEVELGFGGPAGSGNQGDSNDEDVGYATHVHEDMTAHHTVGKAKYLEGPVNRRAPGMPSRLSRRVNQRLKS